MILLVAPDVRARLLAIVRCNPDAAYCRRAQIILLLDNGTSPTVIARMLHCHRDTVYEVVRRFRLEGMTGLADRRRELGQIDGTRATFLVTLSGLVRRSPRELGWQRSTWSCELLAKELASATGQKRHPVTVWRGLRLQGIRYKRARPTIVSPDPERDTKLAALATLKATSPADERLFFEDEVDIHLNPRIGPAWMHKGQQTKVMTPGNNKKVYIAGALDANTGELVWVTGKRKRSELFLRLCVALADACPEARRIHVVVDNFIIHSSKFTRKVLRILEPLRDRVVIHFLPTYSPDENPIEMLWKDMHACVTRNHDAKDIEELLARVEAILTAASPYPGNRPSLARAS